MSLIKTMSHNVLRCVRTSSQQNDRACVYIRRWAYTTCAHLPYNCKSTPPNVETDDGAREMTFNTGVEQTASVK